MAIVWAARQKGTRGFQKIVAVKTMLPKLSDDPSSRRCSSTRRARLADPSPERRARSSISASRTACYLPRHGVGRRRAAQRHATKAAKQGRQSRRASRCGSSSQAGAGLHAAHELRDDDDQLLGSCTATSRRRTSSSRTTASSKIVDFGVAKATAARRRDDAPASSRAKSRTWRPSRRSAAGRSAHRRLRDRHRALPLTTGKHPFRGDNDIATMHNITSRPSLPPRVRTTSRPSSSACWSVPQEGSGQALPDDGGARRRPSSASSPRQGLAVDDDIGAFIRP